MRRPRGIRTCHLPGAGVAGFAYLPLENVLAKENKRLHMRRCEIIGNLGRDAELKLVGDKSVLNFSVGASGSKKDDPTVWHSCSLWGARAEKLAEYMKKGQRVFVRGEFKLRQWSKGDKSGVDVDVTADEIELLGSKEKSEPAGDW
jgi:single-strand DNA-binding protein